mgnify:CR=1 FL=1
MQKRTPIIDSQVHAYESNRPERPWTGHLPGPQEVTGDQMVTAMDTVGVDGALFVSPVMLYRYDASYAVEVYAKHPGLSLIHISEPTRRYAIAGARVGV